MSEKIRCGHLSHDDSFAMAEMLIVASHETTANMITLGTMLLQRYPELWAALAADRRLIASAIEVISAY